MSATETEPNEPNGKASSLTEYVVLRRVVTEDGSAAYLPVAPSIRANSADAACRVQAKETGAGTYVASPVRSFQPTIYNVETEPRITVAGVEPIR